MDLIILTPDHQSRRFPLEGDRVTLGRAHSNDLCYPEDASLSRRHIQFQHTADGWIAEDLGSKNGTLRNGARMEGPTALSPGDRISAGHLMISIVDPEAPSRESVIFVAGEGPEQQPNATIMTSLEGLMSGEATAPLLQPRQSGGEVSRGQAFNTPIVRALVRAGRELAGHRPLAELFKLILDLSIEAVGAERGVSVPVKSLGRSGGGRPRRRDGISPGILLLAVPQSEHGGAGRLRRRGRSFAMGDVSVRLRRACPASRGNSCKYA